MGQAMRSLVLVVFAVCLAASATPYQQMGFRGGVRETPLGPDTWLITAKGNGYTSRSRIVEYTYRRAAEVCPAGFDVVDADRSTRRTYQNVDKSEATLVVRCRQPGR